MICGSASVGSSYNFILLVHSGCDSSILTTQINQDVGNSQFSIIVDESTDVSTEKLLVIIIKYYSQKRNDVIAQFLTFISVVHATAEILFEKVCEFFDSINLSIPSSGQILSPVLGIFTKNVNKERCNTAQLLSDTYKTRQTNVSNFLASNIKTDLLP